MEKKRAPRNKTLTLSDEERTNYSKKLLTSVSEKDLNSLLGKTICSDTMEILPQLPKGFSDLVIVDPPYNLSKDFNGTKFKRMSDTDYREYLESWIPAVLSTLKPSGTIYVCCDWKNSSPVYDILSKHTFVQNRITWQREKGRGTKFSWKNATEDIWFCTPSKDYYFDVESVKQKRRVIAPYKVDGKPKDWDETEDGNFRLTHPSNFWDDISIPYWSMPENTDHPTQKPEKLIAKLVLASSKPGDIVFDPFMGSGTTSVVAKKLDRKYLGIEINEEYCCWAEKRLERAEQDKFIQGYSGGVFWERNTLNQQLQAKRAEPKKLKGEQVGLF